MVTDIKAMLCTPDKSVNGLTGDTTSQLTEIKDALDNANRCGSALEKSSNTIKQEIATLIKEAAGLKTSQRTANDDSTLKHIDSLITDINDQLQSINQHVCVENREHPSLNIAVPTPDPDLDDSSAAMTPNTISPHHTPKAVMPDPSDVCKPYIDYKEDIVSPDLRSRLMKLLDSLSGDFQTVGGTRDVQYFGEYGYWYTGAYHNAKRTPMEIQELLDAIRPILEDKKSLFNSCLITRYTGSTSGIPMHSDDEVTIDPESTIVTVSLGAERTIKFSNGKETTSLQLKDSSVFLMSRFSQDYWSHGIEPLHPKDPEQTDATVSNPVAEDSQQSEHDKPKVPSSDDNHTRYSFTFRHVAPFFKNSTIVIGDSNTQHLKFGDSIGTFGRWTPGKRVKAGKIEHIPHPHEIGCYRNIVINTGINNITDDNRQSNSALIKSLKTKCEQIQKVYPRAKLFISLLLPTKSSYLNVRVNEFNNHILDMSFNRKNMFVIDNSILGLDKGSLSPRYGRHYSNGMPNANDVVHLGRDGLRIFSKNIKSCIMNRGVSQSRERFASHGDYRGAASRGRSGGISSG